MDVLIVGNVWLKIKKLGNFWTLWLDSMELYISLKYRYGKSDEWYNEKIMKFFWK